MPNPVVLVKFIGVVGELWQMFWFVTGVISGNGFTIPLTANVLVTAPVDEQLILPDGEPVAEDVILIYIGVAPTVPPTGDKDRVPAKPLPGIVDTSNPEAAVIIILLVNDEPPTVNDCVVEAVPAQVTNAESEPDTVITWAFAKKPVIRK